MLWILEWCILFGRWPVLQGILQTLKYGSIRDANAAFCLLAALAGLGEGFVNRIIYGMKTSSLKLSFGKITSRSR